MQLFDPQRRFPAQSLLESQSPSPTPHCPSQQLSPPVQAENENSIGEYTWEHKKALFCLGYLHPTRWLCDQVNACSPHSRTFQSTYKPLLDWGCCLQDHQWYQECSFQQLTCISHPKASLGFHIANKWYDLWSCSNYCENLKFFLFMKLILLLPLLQNQ